MATLTEADTCRKYVLPKLYAAGWTDDQISEQKSFTDGRIVVAGEKPTRREQRRADYLLKYRRDFTLAVVEAKSVYKKPGDGLQQAKDYAQTLHERMQANAVYLTRIMLIAASASLVVGVTALIGLLMGGGMVIAPEKDVSAFRALSAMGISLGIMVHHTLGWAYFLIGCAVLKTRSFSRILGWLFIFAGIVWIPTFMVPQLLRISQLPVIAGILAVVATVWIGIALLRQKRPQPAPKEMAASS